MNYSPYHFSFLAAAVFSLALTPLVIRLAHRFKFLDEPGHRKTHEQAVPHLGGLSIFVSLGLTVCIAWLLGFFSMLNDPEKQKIAIVLASSLGMALFGLWDDIFHLKARYKLLGQLLFASSFAFFGFRFEILHVPGLPPFSLGWMAVPLTVFWILSIINALNMVDGLDGLASTVLVGSLFLICAASALVDNPGSLMLCLAAFGAMLGFLKYNWTPARIYLGDAGSNGLGMLAAGLLVGLGQSQNWFPVFGHHTGRSIQPFFYQFFMATLLIAYPALEIIISVTRRLFHGRPISRADKGHIHHRLVYLGWRNQWICLAALCFTLLVGGAVIAVIANYRGIATWLLVASGTLLGLALPLLGFLDFLKPHAFAFTRPHFLIVHHFISMQRAKLSLALRQEEVLALINQVCFEFGVQGYRIQVPADAKGRGGCNISWERSLEDQRDHLSHIATEIDAGNFSQFKDHVDLEGSMGKAHWIFEPHTEESDLDVEYRVLVSEFMKEALAKLAFLKPSPIVALEKHSDRRSRARMTSTLLRRRSVRKFSPASPENPDHN